MRKTLPFLVFSIAITLLSGDAFCVNRVSTGSGNWNTASTWSPAGVPNNADNITIQAGHVVVMNQNFANCLSLTINGTLQYNQQRRLTVGTGGCVISATGDVAGAGNGRLNLEGNLLINAVLTSNTVRIRMRNTPNLVISGTGSMPWLQIRINCSNTGNITVRDIFDGNRTLTNAANATLNVGASSIVCGLTAIANGNTVNYNGAGAQTVYSTDYYNLSITKPAGIVATLGGNVNINNDLTVTSGTFTYTGNNFTCTNNASITGVMNVTNAGGNKTLRHLLVNAGGTWNSAVAENYTIGGNVQNDGTFNASTGVYSLTGVARTISGTSATTIPNITCTGSYTNNANLTVTSTLIGGGVFSQGAVGILNLSVTPANFSVSTFNASAAGNTVNYTLAGNQNVRTPNDAAYHHLGALGTGIKSLLANATINGNLDITSTLDVTASNFSITLGGNWTDAGTFTCRTGTVTLNGTGIQTITKAAGEVFYNLIAAGSSTKMLGGPITVLNDLTISSTLNASASSYSITLGRHWTDNGTFVPQTGTVTLNGTGAQNVSRAGGESFYNLIAAGGGTKTILSAVNVANDLTISSTLDVSISNFALSVGRNWLNTGTFNSRFGTVTLNGSGAQLVTKAAGETFYNLVAGGSGTKSLGGPITVGNNLTINSALDVSASNYAINLRRNWINNGTFTAQMGTVTLNGAVAQSIGGSSVTTFRDLTLNNAAGASMAVNANLRGTLTLTSGNFTATGFTFTILSDAAGTGRIGTITGGDYIGNVTMQRYLPSGPTSWRMLCSPVTGRTLNDWKDDFTMSGFTGSHYPTFSFISVYTYNEATLGIKEMGYVAATDITNPITPNVGYYCYIGPVPLTMEVAGPPVKFNQSFTLSYTPNAGASQDGWNMIGNPYPSSINWDAAGWTKTRINNAIYVWNPALQQYASYVAGVGTNGGTRNIPSTQAFWVQANAASPALSCTENVKTPTDQAFMSTSGSFAFYHLKLTMKGNNQKDETFIRFDPQATVSFDGDYDAHKIFSTSTAVPHLTTVMGGDDLSINSLPAVTSVTSIPVRAKVGVTGTYTISRDSLLNMPMGCCIVLEDKLTGAFINLRNSQSYSFSIRDTTKTPRFVLHIGAPFYKNAFAAGCNGGASGYAVAKGTGSGPWDYEWLDSNWMSISKVLNSYNPDTLKNLVAGTYYIRVTDPNSLCGMITDTVVVQQPQAIQTNLVKTDVNCNGANDATVAINPSGGAPPYTYQWSNSATTQNLTGIGPGTYVLTLTDDNGCVSYDTAVVAQPAPLKALFAATSDTVYLNQGGNLSLTNNSFGAQSYKWIFGDGSLPDTTQNPGNHTYTSAGIYLLKLLAYTQTCSDSAWKNIIVLDSNLTGVVGKDALANTRLINDQAGTWIEFGNNVTGKVTIEVYNAIGQRIVHKPDFKITGTRVKLDMPAVPKGIYLVSLQVGDARQVFAFER